MAIEDGCDSGGTDRIITGATRQPAEQSLKRKTLNLKPLV